MPRRFTRLSCLALWVLAASACDAAPDPGRRAAAADLGVPAAPDSLPAPAAAAAGPRVVFLGTSLTAGLGLRRTSERWPERLEARGEAAGLAFRLSNAGRSGDTSAGGAARLDWILSDTVDLLVVELGANDGLRGLPPESLADNLRAIIDRTREAWPDARILLVGMEAPTNLGPRYTQQFRQVFTTVANERGVPLVPFLLEGVAGVAELNQADGIHPTAEGHARIADTVWPELERLLRATNSPETGR